jgi:hypothetical protein
LFRSLWFTHYRAHGHLVNRAREKNNIKLYRVNFHLKSTKLLKANNVGRFFVKLKEEDLNWIFGYVNATIVEKFYYILLLYVLLNGKSLVLLCDLLLIVPRTHCNEKDEKNFRMHKRSRSKLWVDDEEEKTGPISCYYQLMCRKIFDDFLIAYEF